MKVAFVVGECHAGLQCRGRDFAHLAGLCGAGRFEKLPLGHLGLTAGLAIDGPGRTVVVRRRLARVLVTMSEYREPELRVFIKDLARRHAVVDVAVDKVLIREETLEKSANLLPAGGPRLRL